jgi:UDP-N-acetylmuramoylalanine--D-glutamate ligase
MNKKIVILGGGESGVGAAILAKRTGNTVWLSDGGQLKEQYKQELQQHEVAFEEAQHTEEKIFDADEVIKSPGIPETHPLVKKIRERNIPVIGEIELAYRYKGDSKVIAITGSNGKTTTTALTGHICKHGGASCAVVGNIGYSFARQVALDPKPLYIAEVSSFQLDDTVTFKPDVAVITNITADHLDRYDYRVENYIASKFRIAMNQTAADAFIYCDDDENITTYLDRNPINSNHYPFTMNREINKGAFIKDRVMTIATGQERMEMSIYDFAVKGKHNQYNTMAAGLAASMVEIRKDKIREAITTFESLEHRLEKVATVRGVEFINDSKATNINSTWYALESMEKPTILILGGVDKGNDYNVLLELVQEKVKAIICLGKDNRKIHEAFGKAVKLIVNTSSAPEAVHAAWHFADKGDVVLLSPACASFDLFKNYEDRGIQFKKAVKDL